MEPKRPVISKSRVAEEVSKQAVTVKAEYTEYSAPRISDFIKRFFLMRTSPSTVNKALAELGFVKKTPIKSAKKTFQAELLQSAPDEQAVAERIRLVSQNAYLIGIIDDYIRYMSSLGFYRSQTTEHVLET